MKYLGSRELLNEFASNLQGRRVNWSLARMSLNVKDKGQSPGTKTAFLALLAACVRFRFGKTSLALFFLIFIHILSVVKCKS